MLVMNEVFDLVKKIFEKKNPGVTLRKECTLAELNVDSLDLVEMTSEIEDTFHISFTSAEIAKLETVNNLIELIQTKRK